MFKRTRARTHTQKEQTGLNVDIVYFQVKCIGNLKLKVSYPNEVLVLLDTNDFPNWLQYPLDLVSDCNSVCIRFFF